jgi:hypothetical protein
MTDLEQKIRTRYLDRLDNRWHEEDPRIDFGLCALPYFVTAFSEEKNPERRAKLVRVIWQFRDVVALPTLATALGDPVPEVWKNALDGVVTIGEASRDEALAVLKQARDSAAADPCGSDQLSWIDEAIDQVINGTLGDPNIGG